MGISFLGNSSLRGAPSPIGHPIISPIPIASLVPKIFSHLCAKTHVSVSIFDFLTQHCHRWWWDLLYCHQLGVSNLHEYFQNYSWFSFRLWEFPFWEIFGKRCPITHRPSHHQPHSNSYSGSRDIHQFIFPLNDTDDNDGTFCTVMRTVLATSMNIFKIIDDFPSGRGNNYITFLHNKKPSSLNIFVWLFDVWCLMFDCLIWWLIIMMTNPRIPDGFQMDSGPLFRMDSIRNSWWNPPETVESTGFHPEFFDICISH